MITRRKARFYKGELWDILKAVFAGKINSGGDVEIFEKAFARYIGTRFAIAVSSGRHAMHLLLDSMNLVAGDEIILPADVLEDFIPLILEKDLKPVLVDIEKDSFNIDPTLIEKKITEKTKIILTIHRFGLPADIEKIRSISKKHNLRIIEDCAHGLGASYKGKRIGSFGEAAFFVFGPTKPVNTFGGGMITTDNAQLASSLKEKVKRCRINSKKVLAKIFVTYIEEIVIQSPIYALLNKLFVFKATRNIMVNSFLGFHQSLKPKHSAFANIQAIVGLKQLSGLDERNKKRDLIAQKITKGLNSLLEVQISEHNEGRIFHFFAARISGNIEKVELLRNRLLLRGVDVGIREEFMDNAARFIGRESEYPVTVDIFNKTMQLPMYDDMNEKETNKIMYTLNDVCSRKKK